MFERVSGSSEKSRSIPAWDFRAKLWLGQEMRQGLVDGGVEARRHQRVMETGPLQSVVVNVVGGDHRDAGIAGESGKFTIAFGVALQEVTVQLDVHRIGSVPVHVAIQKLTRLPRGDSPS